MEEIIAYKGDDNRIYATKIEAEQSDFLREKRIANDTMRELFMNNCQYHYHCTSPLLNCGFNLETAIGVILEKAVYSEGKNIFDWMAESFHNIKNKKQHSELGNNPVFK